MFFLQIIFLSRFVFMHQIHRPVKSKATFKKTGYLLILSQKSSSNIMWKFFIIRIYAAV